MSALTMLEPPPLYARPRDIRERIPEETLIQLCDDSSAGSADEILIEEAIRWGDAVINGFLGRRYRVPFSPPKPIVCECSADIATYHLYARRMDIVPDVWQRRWEFWMKWLEDVASGKLSLDEDGTGSGSLLVSAPRQEFTTAALDSFWRMR